MTGISEKINNYCRKQISIAPLVYFRIAFGILVVFAASRFLLNGWVESIYLTPKFHFKFYGFNWVPFPSDWGVYALFIAQIVAGFGIILGAFFRFSCTVFFVCFTWVEFLDKSTYLNHYYLVSILTFLLIFSPAHKQLSIDTKVRNIPKQITVSRLYLIVFQIQVALVYVFAGIAKFESHWLFQAQPLRTWLQAHRDLPLIGNVFASKITAAIFSWFALFYDLTIPLFLGLKSTRKTAFCLVIIFHISTWLLFPIGIFPWVMIVCSGLFFPFKKLETMFSVKSITNESYRFFKFNFFFFVSILFFQILFPLRYLLYSGNLFRTEEGYRFSWRVMLMEKKGTAVFYVEDKKSNRSIQIDNDLYLTPQQEDQMARQPDMILEFAHHIYQKYKDTLFIFGTKKVPLKNPKVCAQVMITLNGSPHFELVNRSVDLSKIPNNLAPKIWISDYYKK